MPMVLLGRKGVSFSGNPTERKTSEKPLTRKQPITKKGQFMNNPKFVASMLGLTVMLGFSAPLLAQGPLAPPGPPSPLFKTLEQVEPRRPISSVPFNITQPG